MTVCYRHPDRATALRCTRCDRYICGDCMRSAAVGQHCVECAQAGGTPVRRAARPLVRAASGTPVVTYGLIALSVLAFVAQLSSHELESELVLWTPAVADGQIYRLVTSAFLHYGPMHLLLNMWALYVVGPQLEGLLGRVRYSALYLLSALGGSVAVYLLAPITTETAGASGAIFGLFGATLVIGQPAADGCPRGGCGDRGQPDLHFHHSAHQLAGTCRWSDHRGAGRVRLRLSAAGQPDPDSGSGQSCAAGTVHRADLVAHCRIGLLIASVSSR